MNLLIAIDDTDNLNTKGTGSRIRALADLLVGLGYGAHGGVTRHQLFVHEEIPYTSHNSSACFLLADATADLEQVVACAAGFLVEHAAEGSDPGLCVAPEERVSERVVRFGREAKRRVLTQAEAKSLAAEEGLHLSGHGGTNGGIIGALAGVGLRRSGDDGRFLAIGRMRELQGVVASGVLRAEAGVRRISTEDGTVIPEPCEVDVGEKLRLILQAGQPTLLVEPEPDAGGRYRQIEQARLKLY